MARISRRDKAKKSPSTVIAGDEGYRTAIYVRLSKEDEEGDSIENQTALLKEYVGRQDDMTLKNVFVDNGFTGTNFDRPKFQHMMDFVKSGKINCIVVKDLSRLGRNYIEAGDYIEKLFPFLKVRFVAINDNFDTKNGYDTSALIVPIKNMVNAVYAKDISKKIISTFRAKQKNGEYIGLAAPFGYNKDPENKNHFVIDHSAAGVVRRIFLLRKKGKGTGLITKQLNEEDVPCPRRYRFERGLSSSDKYKKARWTDSTVKRILTSEVYIGNTVQGKQKQELCNNVPKHRTDRSEWIVAENTHEPIIDRVLFDEVQEIMEQASADVKRRIRNVFPEKEREENILIGHVKCGCCGKALVLKHYICHGHIRREYACRTAQHEGTNACVNRLGIDKHMVENIVFEIVQKSVLQLDDIVRDREICTDKSAEVRKRTVAEMERERIKIRRKLGDLYEDYSQGILDEHEYVLLKERYADTIEKLDSDIKSEQSFPDEVKKVRLSEKLSEYRKSRQLTRTMVDTFVDTVVIHGRDRIEVLLQGNDVIINALKED